MGVSRPAVRQCQLRFPQHADGVGSKLAVLVLFGACWSVTALGRGSGEEVASIGSDGAALALNQRRGATMRREAASSEANVEGGSLLGLNGTRRQSNDPNNLWGEEEKAEVDERGVPLFNWDAGGAWLGLQNQLTGEYGFAFKPTQDIEIMALGRYITNTWQDSQGLGLKAPAWVSLWEGGDSATKTRLAKIDIGQTDHLEVSGKYKFKYLNPPISLKGQKEYRITQGCTKDMEDKWFDEVAFSTDIEQYSAFECIKVTTGVHSATPGAWPEVADETYQRAGMLNMRFTGGQYMNCGMTHAQHEANRKTTTTPFIHYSNHIAAAHQSQHTFDESGRMVQ